MGISSPPCTTTTTTTASTTDSSNPVVDQSAAKSTKPVDVDVNTNVDVNPSSSRSVLHQLSPRRAVTHRHRHLIPHIPQSYSWDCGLACVLMVLRLRGDSATTLSDLCTVCRTDSIWSIDLAYLLRAYNVPSRLYTISRGVCAEYGQQDFYRGQLVQDTKRVNRLFQHAARNNVAVVEQKLSISYIKRLINNEHHDDDEERRRVIIVLVDKRYLVNACLNCDAGCFKERGVGIRGNVREPLAHTGFLGHFIIVYAYNQLLDAFIVKDPAAIVDTCILPVQVIEQARLAFGTDQDLLVIDDCPHTLSSGGQELSSPSDST